MSKGKANPIDAEVGRRIKLRRMAAGLSQTELGKKIDVTFQRIPAAAKLLLPTIATVAS
jgi:transcriptional regulator with XRE-family HTH domain